MSEAVERSCDDWMAWDAEAAVWQEDGRTSLNEARDAVIERWLFNGGDTGPYVDWVLNLGHSPSSRVTRAVALMLAKSANVLSSEQREVVPFGLDVQRDGPGARRDLAAEVRDFLAGREASRMIDARLKARDAADPDTREWLATNGINVSLGTVEAARKAYRRGRGKK